MMDLPTVPCVYCGVPTTYTGTKHCDPCHSAVYTKTGTLVKLLAERLARAAVSEEDRAAIQQLARPQSLPHPLP